MFNVVKKSIQWGGETLTLETGKIARQADGSVVATLGETSVMAAAVITVLWHHQRTHAIAPGIVFVLTGAMLSML